MVACKIDVKLTGRPFNLGRKEKWSEEDLAFLCANGAYVNQVGYVHIPLACIKGEVLLGIGQQAPNGRPPELRVGGRVINTGKIKSIV